MSSIAFFVLLAASLWIGPQSSRDKAEIRMYN